MVRDWERDLKEFEKFLGGLELEKYKELRAIKTVEQDLPQDLLPLEIYYRYYWNTTDFKDFEEVFEIYWHEKLNPHIYNFIKKYFYGCSLQFVEEGFKARLYRIWVPYSPSSTFSTSGMQRRRKRSYPLRSLTRWE